MIRTVSFISFYIAGALQTHEKNQLAIPFFDCKTYPLLCEEPFNCQSATVFDLQLAAKQGHANLRMWCQNPQLYRTIITQCLVNKDLKRSALDLFDWQVSYHQDELDASYCYLEGHCTNEEVTDNTTLKEAEEMCDKRFGHPGWTESLVPDVISTWGAINMDVLLWKPIIDPINGAHEHELTKLRAKTSCIMGSYHCDVSYCKNTYCKISYYVKKYGHLLPKIPGHLLKGY